MTVSAKTKTARTLARKGIAETREVVQSAGKRAEDARSSGFYSEEGTANYVGGWVKDARKKAEGGISKITKRAREARTDAEKRHSDARKVSESERATAAAILAPVIQAGASNPEALINAYVKRAPNSPADRMILEDSIQAMVDADLGGLTFAETWGRTRAALADTVESPEEREAAEDLQALDALDAYIAAARGVAETDLDAIENGGGVQYSAALERARHTVSKYERDTEESSKGRKTLSDKRAEQEAKEAEIIRKWNEMQAQKRAEASDASDASEGSEGETSEGEGSTE